MARKREDRDLSRPLRSSANNPRRLSPPRSAYYSYIGFHIYLPDLPSLIWVLSSYPVAPLYNINLTDAPKQGKYVVTITFTRRGPLSSSASASTIEYFEVK